MAERRCFTMKIIDSDAFLDMPLSTQALYFHLNMRADDDGFVNNPKRIQRMLGCSEDDLKLLLAKRFVIGFERGVIVIKHWRMHNTLRKDRYNPTQYQEEFKSLAIKDNHSYTDNIDNGNQPATAWQPIDNQLAPQINLNKDKLNKEKDDTNVLSKKKDKVDEKFELLWAQYPAGRKQGKTQAKKAFAKAIKEGVGFEVIEAGLFAYKQHIEACRTDTQYIKQGSTWFNQRCWEDEYDDTQRDSAKDKYMF